MRYWQLGILVLLFACAAAAQEVRPYLEPSKTFSVLTNSVVDRIESDQWAEFNIIVRNHQMRTRKIVYGLAEEGVEFSSLTQPTADLVSGFTLEGGTLHTTHYQLKPNFAANGIPSRPFNVQLTVTDPETREREQILLPVWVYPKGYFAGQQINLTTSLITPPRVDPKNQYTFQVQLSNNNGYDIGPVTVEVTGIAAQQTLETHIGPDEQRVLDFTIEYPESQQPMLDAITVKVIRDGVDIGTQSAVVEVVGYRIPYEQRVEQRKSFLKTLTIITVKNNEPVAQQQELTLEAGGFRRKFSHTEPPAAVVGGQYHWALRVAPGETAVLTVATNYRWLGLALLVLIVVLLLWYLTKDPVNVLKYAEQYRMYEGGIVELKVVLSVKNRAGKILEQVQLVDKVPSIAQVKEGESFGTLRPQKVVPGKNGTILRWDIDRMDVQEERIITYILRTKLSILGDIRLPPAMATVTDAKGNAVHIKSNEADVTSQRQAK